jgi:hypothetical protein
VPKPIYKLSTFDFFLFVQADQQSSNYIGIFKLSKISGRKRDLVPSSMNNDEDMEDDDSSSSDEDDDMADAAGGNAPLLQVLLTFPYCFPIWPS